MLKELTEKEQASVDAYYVAKSAGKKAGLEPEATQLAAAVALGTVAANEVFRSKK